MEGLTSTSKGFDNFYYLVSINSFLDVLSFTIKFITYSFEIVVMSPWNNICIHPTLRKSKRDSRTGSWMNLYWNYHIAIGCLALAQWYLDHCLKALETFRWVATENIWIFCYLHVHPQQAFPLVSFCVNIRCIKFTVHKRSDIYSYVIFLLIIMAFMEFLVSSSNKLNGILERMNLSTIKLFLLIAQSDAFRIPSSKVQHLL